MGNRAVITDTKELNSCIELKDRDDKVGIYLHWNGGKDSIVAFLEYCKAREFRGFCDSYGKARLVQVIANYFGGYLSLGVDILSKLDCDNYDNGVYIVDDCFNIVGRKYFEGIEQNSYNLREMLISIDERQPEKDRIGEEGIDQYLKEGNKNG